MAAACGQHPITVDAARTGPLDAQERTAFASLLRRHLPPHDVATVHPPSGHDLTIARLPVPRKGSADAEHSTVDERARLEEKVLTTISVPAAAAAADDSDRHLAAQREAIVKRHKTEYIDAVEQATGLNIASQFTVDDLLELKKSTGYVVRCRAAVQRAHCDLCVLGRQHAMDDAPGTETILRRERIETDVGE